MRHALLGITLLGFWCSAACAQGWYNTDWGFRKKLTLNELDVVGTTNFANFVVPIVINNDAQIGANAQADGDDILFTASDGTTKLDHEKELYNTDADVIAWVKVGTLLAETDTEIFIYYGHPTIDNQDTTNTWSDYAGAWHHNTTGTVTDVTANPNDCTVTGGTLVTGKVGQGLSFPGTTPNRCRAADHTSFDGIFNGSAHFWANADVIDGSNEHMLFKQNGPMGDVLMKLQNAVPPNWRWELDDGTGNKGVAGGTVATGTWYFFALTWSSSDVERGYRGTAAGSFVATGTLGFAGTMEPFSNTAVLDIPHSNFGGSVDEYRIAKLTRSQDWLNSEFLIQDDPVGFLKTTGAQESAPPPAGEKRIMIIG